MLAFPTDDFLLSKYLSTKIAFEAHIMITGTIKISPFFLDCLIAYLADL